MMGFQDVCAWTLVAGLFIYYWGVPGLRWLAGELAGFFLKRGQVRLAMRLRRWHG